jgi:hypothetical protein
MTPEELASIGRREYKRAQDEPDPQLRAVRLGCAERILQRAMARGAA